MVRPSFERWRAGTAYINLKLNELVERNEAKEVPATERMLQKAGDWYLDRRMPSPVIVPLARACTNLFTVVSLLACGACLIGIAVMVCGIGGQESLMPFFRDALIVSMFTAFLMAILATLAMEVPFFLFMSETEAAACREARREKKGRFSMCSRNGRGK